MFFAVAAVVVLLTTTVLATSASFHKPATINPFYGDIATGTKSSAKTSATLKITSIEDNAKVKFWIDANNGTGVSRATANVTVGGSATKTMNYSYFVPAVGKQTKLTTQTAVVMTYGPECVGTINFN